MNELIYSTVYTLKNFKFIPKVIHASLTQKPTLHSTLVKQ